MKKQPGQAFDWIVEIRGDKSTNGVPRTIVVRGTTGVVSDKYGAIGKLIVSDEVGVVAIFESGVWLSLRRSEPRT